MHNDDFLGGGEGGYETADFFLIFLKYTLKSKLLLALQCNNKLNWMIFCQPDENGKYSKKQLSPNKSTTFKLKSIYYSNKT